MTVFSLSRRVTAVAGEVPLPWLHLTTSPARRGLALPCIGRSLAESCLVSQTLVPGAHGWQCLPAYPYPHLCSASVRHYSFYLRSIRRPLPHRERPEAPSPSPHYTGPPQA